MIRRLDRTAAIVLVLCCGASNGFQVARAPVFSSSKSLAVSPHPRRAIHRGNRASLLPALNLADGDDETMIPELVKSDAIETREQKERNANGGDDNTLANVTSKPG